MQLPVLFSAWWWHTVLSCTRQAQTNTLVVSVYLHVPTVQRQPSALPYIPFLSTAFVPTFVIPSHVLLCFWGLYFVSESNHDGESSMVLSRRRNCESYLCSGRCFHNILSSDPNVLWARLWPFTLHTANFNHSEVPLIEVQCHFIELVQEPGGAQDSWAYH